MEWRFQDIAEVILMKLWNLFVQRPEIVNSELKTFENLFFFQNQKLFAKCSSRYVAWNFDNPARKFLSNVSKSFFLKWEKTL